MKPSSPLPPAASPPPPPRPGVPGLQAGGPGLQGVPLCPGCRVSLLSLSPSLGCVSRESLKLPSTILPPPHPLNVRSGSGVWGRGRSPCVASSLLARKPVASIPRTRDGCSEAEVKALLPWPERARVSGPWSPSLRFRRCSGNFCPPRRGRVRTLPWQPVVSAPTGHPGPRAQGDGGPLLHVQVLASTLQLRQRPAGRCAAKLGGVLVAVLSG